MADETTQTAPVAGANEMATHTPTVKEMEDALKKQYPQLIGFLYMSDPDNTNEIWHHFPMPVFDEKAYENLPWHVYKERPSDDLVDPLYSVQKGGWIENAHDAQTQILAQAQAKIVELDKAKEQLEQINSANAQQTQMITKQLGNQAEQNKNIMTMMGQMQQTLAILAKNSQSTSQNGAQTTPVQPTTNPTVNTDTNGGNN
ncbi:hypothetical protein [Lactobacillus helveticus]|uniref:hypothetical protein n=1 Tax=Lactobacillus helveticus TaxID=1587 RepID=UPI00062A9D09|nr:hypothetical protein [Lactobacillus helveticus]